MVVLAKLFHCQKRVTRFFKKRGNPFSHPEVPKSSQNSVIWSVFGSYQEQNNAIYDVFLPCSRPTPFEFPVCVLRFQLLVPASAFFQVAHLTSRQQSQSGTWETVVITLYYIYGVYMYIYCRSIYLYIIYIYYIYTLGYIYYIII